MKMWTGSIGCKRPDEKTKIKNYHIYCNNVFIIFSLFTDFLADYLYVCGTV